MSAASRRPEPLPYRERDLVRHLSSGVLHVVQWIRRPGPLDGVAEFSDLNLIVIGLHPARRDGKADKRCNGTHGIYVAGAFELVERRGLRLVKR